MKIKLGILSWLFQSKGKNGDFILEKKSEKKKFHDIEKQILTYRCLC